MALFDGSKKDFFSKSDETREQINFEFDRLIKQINARRNELISKLDEAVSRYKHLSKESELAFAKLKELKQSSKDILNLNLLTNIQSRVASELDSEIEGMRKEMADLDVCFEWNDDIEEIVPDLGTLTINIDRIGWNNKPLSTVDYASKKACILSKSFSYDIVIRCVCLDQNTSRLYISTYRSRYGILVYNEEGDFIFEFGKDVRQTDYYGIAIHKDKLYISMGDKIFKYRIRNEDIPKRIITLNNYENQLKRAVRLSIDESNGHVYACDSGLNSIVRFNKFLGYHSHISGKDTFSPLDLKITETRLILLVDQPNPYPIRFYSKENPKPLSCLSLEFVPKLFEVDIEGNMLICADGETDIHIFNPYGDLIHRVKVNDRSSYVKGVLLNRTNGRIFLFHYNNTLSIF